MHVSKYITELDEEINKLIHEECDGLTRQNESDLHLLFENRYHVKKWKAEQTEHEAPMRAVSPPPVR